MGMRERTWAAAIPLILAIQCSADTLHLTWAAPFLSGGGYSSEALNLMQCLSSAAPHHALSFVQHGDSYNEAYLSGLPSSTAYFISRHLHQPLPPRKGVTSISVCHSEPGAWNLPSLPRRYSTAQCPELTADYYIGRTMFETDRLPTGWVERLSAMDEVWVPSRFMQDIVVRAGIEATRVQLLGEPVDAAGEFSPSNAASSAAQHPTLPTRTCAAGELPGSSPSCPYRFLSVGKWERRKGFDILLAAYTSAFSPAAAPVVVPQSAPGGPHNHHHVELYILTSSYHGSQDFHSAVSDMLTHTLACRAQNSGQQQHQQHQETPAPLAPQPQPPPQLCLPPPPGLPAPPHTPPHRHSPSGPAGGVQRRGCPGAAQ